MNKLTMILAAAGLFAMAVFAADGDIERGKKIFHGTGEDLDYPSCAHCHATVSAEDELKTGIVHSAFPVYNTSHRGAWKNKKKGGVKSAAHAGRICTIAFQKRKKPGLNDEQLADLNAFLLSKSPSKDVKPRKIGYAPKLPASLDGGDAAKGKKNVEMFCSTCHGPSDDHLQSELKAGRGNKLKIAMKVRGYVTDRKTKKKKFKANNGQMGFFAANRLSDEQLLDILAYLGK